MNPNLPEWTEFDPATERLPVGLGGEGTAIPGAGLIAFVVDSSVESDWAAQSAISLARQWVQGGSKVLVADLFLHDPVLNGALGVENGDGVTDVFMFGASIRHVAKPIRTGGYMLVTAGTAVGDGAAVLSHERWGPVLDGFKEAGVIFVAFVPADAPGLDALLVRAQATVYLAGPGAPAPATEIQVLARLGPAQAVAQAGVEVVEEPAEDSTPGPTPEEPAAEGPAEDEGGFDVGALPGVGSDPVADDGGQEDAPVFSMDALEGDQYGTDGSSESQVSESGMDDLDFGGGLEMEAAETSDGDADLGMGSEPLEMEAPPGMVEDLADTGDATEYEGIPHMEIESSAIVDDTALDDAPAASTMMEGLETGSGFEMQSEETSAAGAAEETEAEADVESDDGFDFGGDLLELEAPPEVEEDAEEDGAALETGPAVDAMPEAEEDFGVSAEDEADDDDAPFLDVTAEIPEEDGTADDPGVTDEGEEAADEPPEAAASSEGVTSAPDTPVPGRKRITEERKLSGLEKLEKTRRRKAFIRFSVIGVALLIVVGGGGYGLMFSGIIQVPGITPEARRRSGVTQPTELPGVTPTTPVMSHALLTQSYNDFQTAWELAGSLSRRLPDAMFFVAPVRQDGRTRWGLFAGPAYSAVEAEALRQPVDDAFGNNFDATVWRVLGTNYAFFFGEYDGVSEAQDRVDGLLGREIPSYILQVDYPNGSSRYRVYGGAYGDEFQAVTMGELLRDQGITEITLTERRGKRPE